MIKNILSAISVGLAVYLFGFAFVIAAIMQGGAGDDALSQHYKGVVGSVLVDNTGHNTTDGIIK